MSMNIALSLPGSEVMRKKPESTGTYVQRAVTNPLAFNVILILTHFSSLLSNTRHQISRKSRVSPVVRDAVIGSEVMSP